MISSIGGNIFFVSISWRRMLKEQISGLMLQHRRGLAGKPVAAGVCQFVL